MAVARCYERAAAALPKVRPTRVATARMPCISIDLAAHLAQIPRVEAM